MSSFSEKPFRSEEEIERDEDLKKLRKRLLGILPLLLIILLIKI